MRQSIFILLFIHVSNILIAQDSATQISKNTIGFNVGYHTGFFEDLNFSPLHYQDNGMLYSIYYKKKKEKSSFLVQLNYSTGNAKTKDREFFNSTYQMVDLRFQYLKKLKLSNEKLHFSLGGQYQFYLNYLDWMNQEAFSFLGNHSLDFSILTKYQLNKKNSILFRLNIPVINYIVRPPYNSFDEELSTNNDEGNLFKIITTGYWGSLNKVIAFEFRPSYRYLFFEKMELEVSYRIRYYKINELYQLRHFQNLLSIGLLFKF